MKLNKFHLLRITLFDYLLYNKQEIKNMNEEKSFFKKYHLIQSNDLPCILGCGAYGSVQLGINKETEKLVAVKKICRKIALEEAIIHKQLIHPNIVKFIDSYFDYQTNSSSIVLQYVKNGTLQDLINSKTKIDQRLICKIFKSICFALQAIHSKSIIHRDIKPSNILLDNQNNPKICDFGNATMKIPATSICGTFQYLAPQILSQKSYGQKSQTWALGVILYQILQHRLPFQQKSKRNLIQEMKQPLKFTSQNSKNFAEMIQKMLKFNEQQRAEITQLIEMLNKIQSSLDKKEKIYQLKQISKNLESSQNSTLDQLEENIENYQQKKKNKSQYYPKKVISLKNYKLLKSSKSASRMEPYFQKQDQKSFILIKHQEKKKISLKGLGKIVLKNAI